MGVIILQILKWILLILGILLLALLVLLLLVLIVPVRYQAEGSFQEKKPKGKGQATWFFHLIRVDFSYEEEPHAEVRICGFKVYSLTGRREAANAE